MRANRPPYTRAISVVASYGNPCKMMHKPVSEVTMRCDGTDADHGEPCYKVSNSMQRLQAPAPFLRCCRKPEMLLCHSIQNCGNLSGRLQGLHGQKNSCTQKVSRYVLQACCATVQAASLRLHRVWSCLVTACTQKKPSGGTTAYSKDQGLDQRKLSWKECLTKHCSSVLRQGCVINNRWTVKDTAYLHQQQADSAHCLAHCTFSSTIVIGMPTPMLSCVTTMRP